MLFHPNKLQLATTGNDDFIKFSNFIEENSTKNRISYWCCSSGQTHCSYASSALCYYFVSNSDEINFCCSFEYLVTIWNEEKNPLNNQSEYIYLRCLAHFDKNNLVISIHYHSSQILVCHQTLVNLWNPINGQFIKSFPWNVHAIAQDPKLSFIAPFQKHFRSSFICIFLKKSNLFR